MDLKASNIVSGDLVLFLRCCYRFLNEAWPHANREPVPDQGFEEAFRALCVSKLQDWNISKIREMHCGEDLLTASGTNHEIDIVGLHDQVSAIVELKHWEASTPTKNEVIVFFAKILDYLVANPKLMLKDVCPIFVSISGFEESGLAACLGLGIHPVGPGLRPLPILVDTAQRMEMEIRLGAAVDDELKKQLMNFWALLHRLSVALEETWISSRYGYLSENALVVKAASCAGFMPLVSNTEACRKFSASCVPSGFVRTACTCSSDKFCARSAARDAFKTPLLQQSTSADIASCSM